MEAKELRLNNYASCQFGIVQISSIRDIECEVHNADFSVNTCVFTSKLEPIPLTEEILLKAGFTMLNRTFYRKDVLGDFGYIICEINGNIEMCVGGYVAARRKSESVHQLQNLYFALTGEELEINL